MNIMVKKIMMCGFWVILMSFLSACAINQPPLKNVALRQGDQITIDPSHDESIEAILPSSTANNPSDVASKMISPIINK